MLKILKREIKKNIKSVKILGTEVKTVRINCYGVDFVNLDKSRLGDRCINCVEVQKFNDFIQVQM